MFSLSFRAWLLHVIAVLLVVLPTLQLFFPVNLDEPLPHLTPWMVLAFLWLAVATSLFIFNFSRSFVIPEEISFSWKHDVSNLISLFASVLTYNTLDNLYPLAPDVLPILHISIVLAVLFGFNAFGLYLAGVRRQPSLA